MGQSTNAVLFYGFTYEDEVSLNEMTGNEDSGDDWEGYYCRKLGIPESVWPLDSNGNQRRREQLTEEEYNTWSAARDVESKATKDCLVEISNHCSGDYGIPYVHVKEAEITVYRGSNKEITLDMLKINPEWDQQIKKFCEIMGIEFKPCGWRLVSYWC
jgi:hypothetical protein